jgi:hypothetical protein
MPCAGAPVIVIGGSMKRSLVLVSVGITALFVAGQASATTYQLTCADTGTDHLEASLQGTSNWTTPSSSAQVQPGDLVELTGTCQGDIVMQTGTGLPISGVTIANRNGNNTFNGTSPDGIDGQVEIRNAQLTLEGIQVIGTSQSLTDVASVYAHDGALLTLNGVDVVSGKFMGVYLLRSSSAQMFNSFVAGNGSSNVAKETDNIRVEMSSSLVLGETNDTQTTNVAFAANGNGITLLSGSSAELYGASIHDDGVSEVEVRGASNVYLNGANLATTGNPAAPFLQVLGASQATIDNNTNIENNTGGTQSGGMLIGGASSAILNTATFATTGTSRPVIEVFGSSNIVLAGGNNICASSTANSCVASSGGTAIEIDHSASMAQEPATALGYSALATETINGAGAIQEQSSIDLGQGTSSLVTWTLNSGEIVNVQQNSSFRMSGGATITGGNGVKIQQGSNGFFNLNNGGTNTATIICANTANNPMAHVSNPSEVSSVTTFNLNDVLTGVSGAAHGGQTNTCLNF